MSLRMHRWMHVSVVLTATLCACLCQGQVVSLMLDDIKIENAAFGSFNNHVVELLYDGGSTRHLYAGVSRMDINNTLYIAILKSADDGESWTTFYGPENTNQRKKITFTDSGAGPPVLAVDNLNRLHVVWSGETGSSSANKSLGHYMVFDGSPRGQGLPLISTPWIDKTGNNSEPGQRIYRCSSKWAMAYNGYGNYDHILWTQRQDGIVPADFSKVNLAKVQVHSNGTLTKSTTPLISNVIGTYGGCTGRLLWEAHYQSIVADPLGRVHLAWNPHFWTYDGSCNGTQLRYNIMYAYSDDNGTTWKRANGDTISPMPIAVDDFSESGSGGTIVSLESYNGSGVTQVYLVSLAANATYVHFLYRVDGADDELRGAWHVVMDRDSGDVISRTRFDANDGFAGWPWHANVAVDPSDDDAAWIIGPYRDAGAESLYNPTVFRSVDAGQSWACWDELYAPLHYFTIPQYDSYIYSTAPNVSLSGNLLPMLTTVYDASAETFSLYSISFPIDAGSIRIAEVDFGLAGQYSQFVITCGTPSQTVTIQQSLTTGSTAVPGCSGVYLGLGGPFITLGASGTVDSDGIVVIDLYVPPGFSGHTAWFQAYETGTCRVSQVESHDFP